MSYPLADFTVRVRLAENAAGRLEAAELWLAREQGISATALRTLPLGRIEALANAPARQGDFYRVPAVFGE